MVDPKDVLEQALSLPRTERAKLVARLTESLDDQPEKKINEAWPAEIERRCAAVDAGTLTTSAWPDVRERIEQEILGR